MAQDISGFGFGARLVASVTFPAGIDLTQFADDTDPFDMPSMKIADTGMGLNGDLVKFSNAAPIKAALALIPGSEDAINLGILFEANRVARGKRSAQDVITLTVSYPAGNTKTATVGIITDGPPSPGIASAGRQKTVVYQFAFENV